MVKVICKRCKHEWEYRGKNKLWCSCTNCKTSVRISIFVEKEKSQLKVLEEKLETEITHLKAKLGGLMVFLSQKHPKVLEKYSDFVIKEGTKEADKILSASLGKNS